MIESDAIRAAVEELRLKAPSPYQASNLSEGQWPWSLRLSAWADEVAADLHGRFSDLVITLGYLRYPDRIPERTIDLDAILKKIPALDTSNVAVGLDGPLGVVSGHTGEHRLAVTNLGVNPITIDTNGRVTAHVLRPATGRLVGVSTEAQTAPLVRFDVLPQGTTLIPLWVGTASVDPSLGFAVPPGVWHAQAELSIGGQRFLTPPLPFEVIDRR